MRPLRTLCTLRALHARTSGHPGAVDPGRALCSLRSLGALGALKSWRPLRALGARCTWRSGRTGEPHLALGAAGAAVIPGDRCLPFRAVLAGFDDVQAAV